MAATMLSTAAVATAAPAQATLVAPFTGLKSAAAFPITRKTADITSITNNGGRVQCMKVWPPIGMKKYETLSYLPPLSPESLAKEVDYLLRSGWVPCLEFELEKGFVYRENNKSPGYYDGRYWVMWKLPMFGCTDSSQANGEPNELVGEINRKREVIEEVKKQLWLAGPLVAVNVLQYFLQMISVMFVGHLGELALSGASLATSFAAVTGFALLLGMASALDTLCGQSYGAKQYHMLGIQTQKAMLILTLVSVPIALMWTKTEHILAIVGQDAQISKVAGHYAQFMIPGLFAYGMLQCLVRFLQTQNIVFPMMISSGVTTLLHVLLCWVLIFKSGLGVKGAALANSISYSINALLLSIYVKFSPKCVETWTGFSTEALRNIPNFLRLAIPSALMVCLELWTFEMMVLMAGRLPNPQLETSVMSISLNTDLTVWMIPVGLSAAVSTRIANELGAGNSRAARLAVRVVSFMALSEGVTMGIILILIRNVWGRAYSKERHVIRYVAAMMPLVALSSFLDGLQCVLSGIARGCGWQKIGAFINLGSYYLVGIPSAIVLGFVCHLGGKGLWIGLICALAVQFICLSIITIRTNWDKEAMKANKRVCDSMSS